jgi:hypothetical protein
MASPHSLTWSGNLRGHDVSVANGDIILVRCLGLWSVAVTSRAFVRSEAASDADAKAAALDEFNRLQRSSQSLGCHKRRGEPPSSQWAVSFYPDVMYRFGEIEMEGSRFRANQLLQAPTATGMSCGSSSPRTTPATGFCPRSRTARAAM